jgi:hypothetical protein
MVTPYPLKVCRIRDSSPASMPSQEGAYSLDLVPAAPPTASSPDLIGALIGETDI